MMKNFKLLVFALVITLASCSPSDTKQTKEIIIHESDIIQRSVGVNGMTCVGCEVTLEESVSSIEGVVTVKASHSDNKAIIEFDSTKTNLNSIKQIIKEAGYQSY